MKWVEHPEDSCSNPNKEKTLGDFFSFLLAFVDRVIWYLLLWEETVYTKARTDRKKLPNVFVSTAI